MEWSIFDYDNQFITTTREEINGVPCLKCRPKGSSGLLPTVIYYHGWHASKEFVKFEAMTIASYGFQLIIPDALYHGERNAIDHDDPENLRRYLWEIISNSIHESGKFIEKIVQDHNGDLSRMGVIGSSMGAITAGGVFIENTNLKCLVAFNGTFAWNEAVKRKHLPESSDYSQAIECYDPIKNVDKINERAISILHGVEDTSVPIETQRLFYDKMLPLYTKEPSKLELIEYSKVDHKTTIGMLDRAITWFIKHL